MPDRPLSTSEAAFLEQFYKAEYKRLYSYALHILHSSSLAEVAVQETFVVAAQRIETVMTHETPVGWLFVTLKNIINSIRRDQAMLQQHFVSQDEVIEHAVQMDEPEALNLHDPDLILLKCFYLDGYSLAELADKRGCTIGALKMHISRLKKRLREDSAIIEIKKYYD